jgi:hypothetical protein
LETHETVKVKVKVKVLSDLHHVHGAGHKNRYVANIASIPMMEELVFKVLMGMTLEFTCFGQGGMKGHYPLQSVLLYGF